MSPLAKARRTCPVKRGWYLDGSARAPVNDRLAVDADRDLRRIGGNLDLLRGQLCDPVGPAAAEQIDGLTGGAHRDADHAERAAIQPRTGTQARGPGLPGSAPGQLTVILPAPPAR